MKGQNMKKNRLNDFFLKDPEKIKYDRRFNEGKYNYHYNYPTLQRISFYINWTIWILILGLIIRLIWRMLNG